MSGKLNKFPMSPESKSSLWGSLGFFSESQPPRKTLQIPGTRDLTMFAPTPVPRSVLPRDCTAGSVATSFRKGR